MIWVVQYGLSAFIGPFRADSDEVYPRGSEVLIRSPRGLEVGEVLCPAPAWSQGLLDPEAGGELLGPVPDDAHADRQARSALVDQIWSDVEAESTRQDWPICIVGVELLHDRFSAILNILGWGDLPSLESLSTRHRLTLHWLNVGQIPAAPMAAEPAGCGKPGCGSSSGGGCSSCGTSKGGCSTGSCSRGSVKSPDEMTAYFAELRKSMEAASRHRHPLH